MHKTDAGFPCQFIFACGDDVPEGCPVRSVLQDGTGFHPERRPDFPADYNKLDHPFQ